LLSAHTCPLRTAPTPLTAHLLVRPQRALIKSPGLRFVNGEFRHTCACD
jgi:hypothetical protein